MTVNPLPNNMSIRRNTRKLTENSNFPGDKQKMRQKQKTKGNWTVVSESLISVWRDKNQVTTYFTRAHMQNHAQCCPCPSTPKIRHYAASAAPASITIIAQSFVLLGCRGSISQWLLQELTKYFQAAAADPVSSIQAPVDTVEQQAEHCQEGKKAGRRNKHGRKFGYACAFYVLGKKMSNT